MNQVDYQMSLEESLRTGFRRKMLRSRFLIRLALLLLGGVLLMVASGGRGVFFYFGLFAIGFTLLVPIRLNLVLRRILTKYPWLTAPTTLTFGESGIAVAAPDFRSELGWSHFRSWAQSDAYVFLFIDAGNAAITIPKRAFSPDQLKTLLGYAARIGA